MQEGLALDPTDRTLLMALQDDCTESLAALGERVGLRPPAVLERVRRLEKAGIVRGYHAQVDARLAGLDIGAFIGVGIDHPKHMAAFEKAVLAIPSVLECHHVTGRHTLVLKIRTQNTESLHALISELRELPGVDRTETMIVLETKVERTKIELPEADAAPKVRGRRPR